MIYNLDAKSTDALNGIIPTDDVPCNFKSIAIACEPLLPNVVLAIWLSISDLHCISFRSRYQRSTQINSALDGEVLRDWSIIRDMKPRETVLHFPSVTCKPDRFAGGSGHCGGCTSSSISLRESRVSSSTSRCDTPTIITSSSRRQGLVL